MRKLHIALGVISLSDSIADYTQRLSSQPKVIVPDQYALWCTATLNFSIRQVAPGDVSGLRHLGWEESESNAFAETRDCNGILWEEFNYQQQLEEIIELWPDAEIRPDA